MMHSLRPSVLHVSVTRGALDLLLRKAQSTLGALNVEVSDEAAEATSPLMLPRGSLDGARLALTEGVVGK